MAAFVHFYRISPDDYWNLTVAEHAAMVEYAENVAKGATDG